MNSFGQSMRGLIPFILDISDNRPTKLRRLFKHCISRTLEDLASILSMPTYLRTAFGTSLSMILKGSQPRYILSSVQPVYRRFCVTSYLTLGFTLNKTLRFRYILE